jgi:hypothetical protein
VVSEIVPAGARHQRWARFALPAAALVVSWAFVGPMLGLHVAAVVAGLVVLFEARALTHRCTACRTAVPWSLLSPAEHADSRPRRLLRTRIAVAILVVGTVTAGRFLIGRSLDVESAGATWSVKVPSTYRSSRRLEPKITSKLGDVAVRGEVAGGGLGTVAEFGLVRCSYPKEAATAPTGGSLVERELRNVLVDMKMAVGETGGVPATEGQPVGLEAPVQAPLGTETKVGRARGWSEGSDLVIAYFVADRDDDAAGMAFLRSARRTGNGK